MYSVESKLGPTKVQYRRKKRTGQVSVFDLANTIVLPCQ